MVPQPRTDGLTLLTLCKLSERHLLDAQALLKARRWAGAYYLAGYSVECALKACIAKQFRRHEVPNRKTVNDFYTHSLSDLLKLAGLTTAYEQRRMHPDQFESYWKHVVTKWNAESRYENKTRPMATELYRAVSDTKEGIVPWIRQFW